MLFSNSIRTLERAMDAATLRQRTIANNIANVDTPHFKSKQVVFESMLAQEMNSSQPSLAAYTTNAKHIPFGRQKNSLPLPQILNNPSTLIQNNGNNVDIESEMAAQAKNQIWYNGLTQFTNNYYAKLKNVIEGGGR